MANPTHWSSWLPMATAMHNNRVNTTMQLSLNQVLIGFNPKLYHNDARAMVNEEANQHAASMECFRQLAVEAINQKANSVPPAQYQPGEKVWLEATHLKLLYQMTKLAPKRYGPFVITKEILPVVYQLALPHAWKIHNVFHASLLLPYHRTILYRPNFS